MVRRAFHLLLASGILAIALLPSANAGTRNGPNSVAEIRQYLKENPYATMEQLLLALNNSLTVGYSLVYDSQSPIGASLEKPRIIMSGGSAKGALILACASDEKMEGGNRLEMIELLKDSVLPTFKQVIFRPGGHVFEENPLSCFGCHARDGKSAEELRYIWDNYPDWPGVFGSSHNGNLYREGSGSSYIPRLEFEERAFLQLKAKLPQFPRLQALYDLENKTLQDLQGHNTNLTDKIQKLQIQIALRRALGMRGGAASAPDFYSAILKKPAGYSPNAKALGEFKEMLTTGADFKIKRIRELIAKYGTADDKALLNQEWPVATVVNGRPLADKAGPPGPALLVNELNQESMPNSADVKEVMDRLGMDIRAFATARNPKAFEFSSGGSIRTNIFFDLWRPLEVIMNPAALQKRLEEEISSIQTAEDFLRTFDSRTPKEDYARVPLEMNKWLDHLKTRLTESVGRFLELHPTQEEVRRLAQSPLADDHLRNDLLVLSENLDLLKNGEHHPMADLVKAAHARCLARALKGVSRD